MFGQSIRTNNDTEGWHKRLNAKAKKARLPFYCLVELLYNESEMMTVNAHLVCENRLRRYQRSKYKTIQGDIFKAWDEYTEKKISPSQLLTVCANIYGPTETNG